MRELFGHEHAQPRTRRSAQADVLAGRRLSGLDQPDARQGAAPGGAVGGLCVDVHPPPGGDVPPHDVLGPQPIDRPAVAPRRQPALPWLLLGAFWLCGGSYSSRPRRWIDDGRASGEHPRSPPPHPSLFDPDRRRQMARRHGPGAPHRYGSPPLSRPPIFLRRSRSRRRSVLVRGHSPRRRRHDRGVTGRGGAVPPDPRPAHGVFFLRRPELPRPFRLGPRHCGPLPLVGDPGDPRRRGPADSRDARLLRRRNRAAGREPRLPRPHPGTGSHRAGVGRWGLVRAGIGGVRDHRDGAPRGRDRDRRIDKRPGRAGVDPRAVCQARALRSPRGDSPHPRLGYGDLLHALGSALASPGSALRISRAPCGPARSGDIRSRGGGDPLSPPHHAPLKSREDTEAGVLQRPDLFAGDL